MCVDFPVEITEDGGIRYTRSDDPETNKVIYKLLSACSGKELEEVQRFLEEGNDITLLFGDRILCG